MSVSQLTIYGAGLIGGSIALMARRAGFAERVVAIDRTIPADPDLLNIFDAWATDPESQRSALEKSDLTVLCVPVRTIIEVLPAVLSTTPGIVTDTGSTKVHICNAVSDHPDRARFVAAHPMAGAPEGGLLNAACDLFEKRRWLISPAKSSQSAIDRVVDLVVSLGALPIMLSAEDHDRSVAATSHVPQVIASALSVFASTTDALQAAGPGFASATRVAGGAEAMWGDIFATNGEMIGSALEQVAAQLADLGRDLKEGDRSTAIALLAQARQLRDAEKKP